MSGSVVKESAFDQDQPARRDCHAWKHRNNRSAFTRGALVVSTVCAPIGKALRGSLNETRGRRLSTLALEGTIVRWRNRSFVPGTLKPLDAFRRMPVAAAVAVAVAQTCCGPSAP